MRASIRPGTRQFSEERRRLLWWWGSTEDGLETVLAQPCGLISPRAAVALRDYSFLAGIFRRRNGMKARARDETCSATPTVLSLRFLGLGSSQGGRHRRRFHTSSVGRHHRWGVLGRARRDGCHLHDPGLARPMCEDRANTAGLEAAEAEVTRAPGHPGTRAPEHPSTAPPTPPGGSRARG